MKLCKAIYCRRICVRNNQTVWQIARLDLRILPPQPRGTGVLRDWRTKEGSWRRDLRASLVAAKSGMEHLKSSGAICATLPTGQSFVATFWLHPNP